MPIVGLVVEQSIVAQALLISQLDKMQLDALVPHLNGAGRLG
jgi:hypothetical protein